MTSIEITTRELHDLLTPVLPHTGDGKGLPALATVRLEVHDRVLYAIATDRYTMGITRHPLDEPTPDATIAIGRADADAMLRLFKHAKNNDPQLRLTVGNVAAETVLDPTERPALTITAKDGATLVLHGRQDAVSNWRNLVAKLVHRKPQPASPSIALTAMQLPRWTKSLAKSSQLQVFLGANTSDPVIIRDGDHFIGIWAAHSHHDSETLLADSPWGRELPYKADKPEEAPPARPAKDKRAAA